jgi:lipopolysaccharide export system protein LptA
MRVSAGAVFCVALAFAASAGVAAGAPAPTPANRGVPNAVQGFSENREKPVQIESTSLEVRDKSGIATFTGNVHVVQGDTTMRCKQLVVFYEQNANATPGAVKVATPGPNNQQKISKMEAKGGVIVTQLDQTATGDTGYFDMKSNTVTLVGNVVVSQGTNVVRGERLVVHMTTGVSRVESGKTHGPVRMLIQQTPAKDGTPPSNAPKGTPTRP